MIPITVDRIVDGDTLVGTIHLPYEVDLRNQEIRALGYDAWESRHVQRTGSASISDEELAKGKAAREFFASLIHSGPVFIEADPVRWTWRLSHAS